MDGGGRLVRPVFRSAQTDPSVKREDVCLDIRLEGMVTYGQLMLPEIQHARVVVERQMAFLSTCQLEFQIGRSIDLLSFPWEIQVRDEPIHQLVAKSYVI